MIVTHQDRESNPTTIWFLALNSSGTPRKIISLPTYWTITDISILCNDAFHKRYASIYIKRCAYRTNISINYKSPHYCLCIHNFKGLADIDSHCVRGTFLTLVWCIHNACSLIFTVVWDVVSLQFIGGWGGSLMYVYPAWE